MLLQFGIMALDGVISSSTEAAAKEIGMSEEDLFNMLQEGHTVVNESGKAELESRGYAFTDGEGVEDTMWTGVGAGLLTLVYLYHTKATLQHMEKEEEPPGPIN